MSGRRTAFTLLEVVLAVALTGMVLAAATSMVVSVSEIWVTREEDTFFVDHVDGVAEFLQTCFDNAGIVTAESGEAISGRDDGDDGGDGDGDGDGADAGGADPDAAQPGDRSTGNAGDDDDPVRFAYLPGDRSRREQYLHFRLSGSPPLLAGVETEIQLVDCYLNFDPQSGLSLLWSSNLQEEVEDADDLFRTEVSALVTAIKYIYFEEDFEDWEVEDEPREAGGRTGRYQLPPFIQIVFTYEEETMERLFTLPIRSSGILLF